MKWKLTLICSFSALLLSLLVWQKFWKHPKRAVSSVKLEKTLNFVWREDPWKLKLIVEGDLASYSKEDFHLKDEKGEELEFTSLAQEDDALVLKMPEAKPLSLATQYLLSYGAKTLYAYPSLNFLNNSFTYEGPLGLHATKKKIDFFLWSPTATQIKIRFFDSKEASKPFLVLPLAQGEKGLWSVSLENKNLTGKLYELEVTAFGKTLSALDPYALNLASYPPAEKKISRAFVVLREDIKNPHRGKSNAELMKDAMGFVGYETHVRDFSIDPSLTKVPQKEKGTFSGMIRLAPHLQDLGITHVQLLPIFHYATVNERQRAFQDGKLESSKLNYNWGYDTEHYFSLEGWLSAQAESPTFRIKEFQNLVESLQQKNIGVIVDVVYNHIYSLATFENVAPGCYLRRTKTGEISFHTGAGASLESRMVMMRRLIIDSLKHLRDSFHVNGVRFDLMGFIDIETLREAQAALGEDFILYGEGWDFTDLPFDQAPTKSHLPENFPVGLFNDSSRDAYSGTGVDLGFAQGASTQGPKAKTGIVGGLKAYPTKDIFIAEDRYQLFAPLPQNTMNFLSIHDGFTLWDKTNLVLTASLEEKKNLMKMALAMLMTSQGRVVLHGGDEFARTKPLAPNDPEKNRAHSSEHVIPEKGVTYFHENSYRSPDVTNMFDWARLEKFKDVYSYLKGLISLRKSFSAFHYSKGEEIKKGLRFIGEKVPELPEVGPYQNFEELGSLELHFSHGPKNKTLYLVGEIFGASQSDKNPKENPYAVSFDEKGEGRVELRKETLSDLDLKAWSDPENLQFKLVFAPGEWNSPEGAYSGMGNNTVVLKYLGKDKIASFDLALRDHRSGEKPFYHSPYIAYTLEARLNDPSCPYRFFLVVHNNSKKSENFFFKELSSFANYDVLVDDKNAGSKALKESSVSLEKGKVTIPQQTTAVLGLY